MHNPKISVTMPAYNAANTITSTLTSVLNQTLKDIEVVVVDDGSVDNTVQLVKELIKQDQRIRLIELQKNRGVAFARNVALQEAKGEWLAVVDSDDSIDADRLSVLLNYAIANEADIVADNLRIIDGKNKNFLGMLFSPGQALYGNFGLDGLRFVELNPLGAKKGFGLIKPLIRRGFIEFHGIQYVESLRFMEDFIFILHCLIKGARLHMYPEAHYEYMVYENSTGRKKAWKDIENVANETEVLASLANQSGNLKLAQKLKERACCTKREVVPLRRFQFNIQQHFYLEALKEFIRSPYLPYVFWLRFRKKGFTDAG